MASHEELQKLCDALTLYTARLAQENALLMGLVEQAGLSTTISEACACGRPRPLHGQPPRIPLSTRK